MSGCEQRPGCALIGLAPGVREQFQAAQLPVIYYDRLSDACSGVSADERAALWSEDEMNQPADENAPRPMSEEEIDALFAGIGGASAPEQPSESENDATSDAAETRVMSQAQKTAEGRCRGER